MKRCREETEPDRLEAAVGVVEEVSVEVVAVVAGWEVIVPDLAPLVIVSVLVAERD